MGRKKKSVNLSRRDFVQMGAIAGLAMPFLKSQVAMGQTATAPTRLLIVPLAHGWGVDNSISTGRMTGSNTSITLPRPLAPLNTHRDQIVGIDSLRTSYWGNAHDVSYADIMTCSVAPDAPAASALGGPFMYPRTPSIDWLIGNATGKNVLRLSHSYTSWGATHHPLSFDNSLRNLPYYRTARDGYMAVVDPLKKMQQPTTPNADKASNDELMKFLGSSSQRLLNRLSGTPKARLESYIMGMNSLGNRISSPASGGGTGNVPLPDLPGMSLAFAAQMDHYLELIRVAFTLDTYRVAVLGLGEGATGWTWQNSSGATQTGNTFGTDFHQQVAHYGSTDSTSAMHGWTQWYSQKIAGFIQTLKNITDVDGRPLIDNTLIVLTGEVGNGVHDREQFGHIVIGGGGQGRILRNRLIKLPTFDARSRGGIVWGSRKMDGSLDISTNNYSVVARHHAADLWVSVARLCGLNINTFGFDVYNYQPISLTA